MANIVIPFAAVAHQQVPSVGFNNNFTEVATKFNTFAVQTDVVKTITVSHIWTATQTFPGLVLTNDLLFTDALYDIGKNGATRPRDGFFSRNLSAQGTLIVTGQTTFAAQMNQNADIMLNGRIFGTNDANGLRFGINGVGSGWKVDLNLALASLTSSAKVIGGTVNFIHRNNADTFDNMVIADGGDVTVSRGRLLLGAAASKIVPGVTSVSLRNNADSADNVLVSDIGNVTIRAGLATGGSITAPISPTAGSFHATPTAADPAISTSDGDIWVMTTGALKVKLNGSVRTMWHSGQISTGYAAWTGTLNRATVLDQSTATLAQVAQRLAALQNDLMTAAILST